MLFAPPGVDLNADDRKQLQRKRLRLIQAGEWAVLLGSLKTATQARRKELRSAVDHESDFDAIKTKIVRGKMAEALDKPVKRIVLTAGEIEEKLKPKHFPHLDPTGEQQTLTTPARSSPISTTRIYGALSMMTRHVAHLASQHVFGSRSTTINLAWSWL